MSSSTSCSRTVSPSRWPARRSPAMASVKAQVVEDEAGAAPGRRASCSSARDNGPAAPPRGPRSPGAPRWSGPEPGRPGVAVRAPSEAGRELPSPGLRREDRPCATPPGAPNHSEAAVRAHRLGRCPGQPGRELLHSTPLRESQLRAEYAVGVLAVHDRQPSSDRDEGQGEQPARGTGHYQPNHQDDRREKNRGGRDQPEPAADSRCGPATGPRGRPPRAAGRRRMTRRRGSRHNADTTAGELVVDGMCGLDPGRVVPRPASPPTAPPRRL